MKKRYYVLILIFILVSIFRVCYGQDLVLNNTNNNDYVEQQLSLYINNKKINLDTEPLIVDNRTLVPLRGVFEEIGADVKWDNNLKMAIIEYNKIIIKLSIDNNIMYIGDKEITIDVPAKLINNTTMLPLRIISENLNFKVQYKHETREIFINELVETVQTQESQPEEIQTNISISSINVSKSDNKYIVKINATDKITNYDKFFLDKTLGDFERIGININNSVMKVKNVNYEVAKDLINELKYAQHDTSTARIVFCLNYYCDYSIKLSDDEKSLIITFGENEGIPDETIKLNSIEELNRVLDSNTITVKNSTTTTDIIIKRTQNQTYKISEGDNKLIVELNPASFSKAKQQVYINDKVVNNIITSMNEATGKIVINLLKNAKYTSSDTENSITIKIERPAYSKQISYKKQNGMGVITLDKEVTSQILFSEDLSNKRIIGQISTKVVNLANTNLQINDDILRSIYVEKKNDYYEIQINYVNPIYYGVVSGKNDTSIINVITQGKLVTPNKKGYKVVIDAGHGGTEIGAIRQGINEKDITLDIALRVQKLLEQNDIEVVMTRESDINVGLKERANISNNTNANMFVSIHINAYDDTSVSGTETLYFPSSNNSKGITGKRISEIIQSSLISTLGTKDRGIKSRPNLVVLNSTEIPAVLTEIAFMSNKEDMAKLQQISFIQKTAEAIYNGIVRSLNEIR